MQNSDIQKRLLADFFNNKTHISGEEIVSFCAEKQINMFILYFLMHTWKAELNTLKSPYFNYQHPDVKSALDDFMNTLSRHILIKKEDFEPILSKAIDFTLQLAENPESFMVSNRLENELHLIKKYIVLHKPYFEGDATYEPVSLLNEIFNRIGIISNETENDLPTNNQPTKNQQLLSNEDCENEEDVPVIIRKIEHIKNAITINQRFVFIRELFNGDIQKYEDAIQQLDTCNSIEEAEKIMQNLFTEEFDNETINQIKLLIHQKYNFTAK